FERWWALSVSNLRIRRSQLRSFLRNLALPCFDRYAIFSMFSGLCLHYWASIGRKRRVNTVSARTRALGGVFCISLCQWGNPPHVGFFRNSNQTPPVQFEECSFPSPSVL